MRAFMMIFMWLSSAGIAFADISQEKIIAYNEALETGANPETTLKAAQDLIAEALANPAEEDAVILAYEAGVRLCTIGACKDAKSAADFVTQAEPTDTTTYPTPIDRALLSAYVDWSIDQTRKTDKAFDLALGDAAPTEPTNLSISAFEARYLRDIQNGKPWRVAKNAKEAATHIQPIADVLPQSYVNAALYGAISDFNHTQSVDALRDVTHLRGWLGRYRRSAEGPAKAWSSREQDRTHAWGLSMNAWFISSGEGDGLSDRQVDAILAEYETEVPETSLDTDDVSGDDRLPFCEGQLEMKPALRYPDNQIDRGLFGAVIANYDFEEGKIVNLVISASVPEEGFKEEASETVSKWRWVPNEGQVPEENCRLSRENVVLPLVFALR